MNDQKIPGKFAENKRGEVKEKAIIRGPCGASWEVALLKSDDGELYFGDGWEKFVNDHALKQNDILIFKYTGNSQFDVLMLDRRTLCEKEGSYFVSKCGHARSSADCKELIESTQNKKPRTVEDNCNEGLELKKPITQAEKMAAVLKARRELTGESFIVVMHPTHVRTKYYLNVPAEWLTRHQIHRNHDVILRTREDSWHSKLSFTGRGNGGISRGWREFVMGNSLEEYDVCLFKLGSPKHEPITLDVTIFRVEGQSNKSS